MALGSSGVCHAATPLINFDKSHGALIDVDETDSLFGGMRSFNLTEDPYSLFDVEPDLTKNEVANSFKKSKFVYKPKRDFLVNLHNINNNEKLSHMVTRFDSGIGYYNSRLNYFFRDWRENKSIPMDSEVLKNLFSICEEVLGQNATINVQIASGYRTQKTNEKLRVRSKNVAKKLGLIRYQKNLIADIQFVQSSFAFEVKATFFISFFNLGPLIFGNF